MKTQEEIEQLIDKAESEIMKVLCKYDLTIGVLYPEGIAPTLVYMQEYTNGDISVFEREAF